MAPLCRAISAVNALKHNYIVVPFKMGNCTHSVLERKMLTENSQIFFKKIILGLKGNLFGWYKGGDSETTLPSKLLFSFFYPYPRGRWNKSLCNVTYVFSKSVNLQVRTLWLEYVAICLLEEGR